MAAGGKLSHISRTVSLVHRLLSGETLDADTAAKVLGVKRPAADRQLKALAAIRGVVVERGSRPKRYTFDRFSLGDQPSFPTAIAACFGATLAPLFAGTNYHGAMSAAREHVHRLTKKGAKFRHIDRKFVFVTGGGEAALPDKGGELDDLLQALIEQTWVKLEYRRFTGELTRRRVQPLSLVVYNHQLYLIARGADRTIHHPYRFARIESVEDEETAFEYPTRNEYDPQQFFTHSFGIFAGDPAPVVHVVVRLNKRWSTYASTHRWHMTQRITVRPTEVMVELDVRVCPELEAWVLGFGEDAEVIEPTDMRDRIVSRLQRATARYAAEGRK